MMINKVLFVVILAVILSGSITYVWTQDFLLHKTSECLKIGEIPKIEKFGNNGYISSCISLNPFENTK